MKRWRLVLDMRRCFLTNSESFEMREFHDVHTHRNFWRNFTGSESWSDRLSVEVVTRCCTVSGGGGGVVVFVISSGGVSVDMVLDNVTVIM